MPLVLKWILIGFLWFGSLIGVFFLGSHETLAMLGHESSWPEVLKGVSDAMTSLGILGAGAWALYLIRQRRSLESRVEILHHTSVWDQGANTPVLRLAVEIRNPSEVAIKPGDGRTVIQVPPGSPFDPKVYAVKQWVGLTKIRHCLSYEDVRIEPKESETYTHDIPLPHGSRYLQIHSELACKRTAAVGSSAKGERPKEDLEIPERDERWTLITFLDLQKLQAPKISSTSAATDSSTKPTPDA